jgi:acyl-CoA synthetase (AMP-forming)/AMP-acid ligase II
MDLIATHAARQPDHPAIIDGDTVLSWRDFFEQRNRLAHGLVRLGLKPGDHVIVYAPNSADVLLAGAAVRAVSAVPVPMNHRLTADEAAYILDDSDAVLVFAGDAFLPVVEAVRARAPRVRHWVLLGVERRGWASHLDDLVAAGRPEPVEVDLGESLGGSMIYTAGTTGKPKGALRRAFDPRSVMPALTALDVARPHVHLAAGPLYHSAPSGFVVYTHAFGGTVVVMRKFDPEQALTAIARHRCTSTFMAPTLLKRIVELPAAVHRRYDLSSMNVIIVAGAPCPMIVKEQVVALFGPVLYEFYGSTELGINTILPPADVLRKPGSCGKAAPNVELCIVDDDGRPVPTGVAGELVMRRHGAVFDEYYKNPQATRDMARGEWLSVGDVAYMDDEGYVYICDRKRDMIISGGVNIYPAEIEDALHRHPKIRDVAVFGVPDEAWGEHVHAAIQPQAGEVLTENEVVDFARRHLADFKSPRSVSFHADFPRDTAGKLLKRLLREPYWAGRQVRV